MSCLHNLTQLAMEIILVLHIFAVQNVLSLLLIHREDTSPRQFGIFVPA